MIHKVKERFEQIGIACLLGFWKKYRSSQEKRENKAKRKLKFGETIEPASIPDERKKIPKPIKAKIV